MSFLQTLNQIPASIKQGLLITFTTGLMFWTSMASLLPTLPLYVSSLGGTTAQVGFVMGAFAIGLILCRSFLGRFADRHGRKAIMQIGLVVAVIIPLFYATLPGIPEMIVLRAIHGISIAAFATGYSALVADLALPEQRGEIIGYMSLVNPLGLALGPALGGWVQEAWGYKLLFLITAAIALVGLICTHKIQDAEVFKESLTSKPAINLSIWKTLISPRIRIPTLILFLIGLVFGNLSSFLPLLIKSEQIPLNVGLFYMAAAIGGFGIRLPVARISDRYGRGLFISLGLCFYTISMSLIYVSHSPQMFLVSGVCEGLGSGIVIPAIATLLADRTLPNERGFVFSISWAGFDMGLALAGPTMGNIISLVGLANAFIIATALCLLALIIFMTFSSYSLSASWQFAIGRAKDQYALSNC